MGLNFKKTLFVLLVAFSINKSEASIWNQVGNPGDTPVTAQITSGNGTLNTILGAPNNFSDVDMYKIRLNGGLFSASVNNGSLFLFDSAGYALIGHKSSISATYQSGLYYLATAPVASDPYAYIGGIDKAIFPILCGPASSGCNNFPSAGSSNLIVSSWGGAFTPSSPRASYPIQLTGASFAVQTTPVPLPAALWLFGSIVTGFIGVRHFKQIGKLA